MHNTFDTSLLSDILLPMNGLDELSSFLYNILPGTLFVILVDGLELLPDHYLKSDDNNYIFFTLYQK